MINKTYMKQWWTDNGCWDAIAPRAHPPFVFMGPSFSNKVAPMGPLHLTCIPKKNLPVRP